MNRKLWISTFVVGSLSLSAGLAQAQEMAGQMPPPPPMFLEQGRGPGGPGGPGPGGPGHEFGGPMELLGFGGMHGGKVVKGVPFSAVAVSESTQTLSDGNHISLKTQANLFRDSLGRVRKEVTFPAPGGQAASGQTKSIVFLMDPVAGTSYMLDVQKKIAWQMPAHRGGPPNEDAAGNPNVRGQHTRTEPNVTAEELGAQVISGVSAQGTRHTHTIAAGQMGNEKPITSTSEQWYSADLQIMVMSKRSDPRSGDSTYTLTNVQRQEPAASLFTVPADYTVKQGSGHRGGKHNFRRGGPHTAAPDGAPDAAPAPPPAPAPAS